MGLRQFLPATAHTAFNTKDECLHQLSKMSVESLRMLAELSIKPGIEKKLKDKYGLIKTFL